MKEERIYAWVRPCRRSSDARSRSCLIRERQSCQTTRAPGGGQVGQCLTDAAHRPLPACCPCDAATLEPEQVQQRSWRQLSPVVSSRPSAYTHTTTHITTRCFVRIRLLTTDIVDLDQCGWVNRFGSCECRFVHDLICSRSNRPTDQVQPSSVGSAQSAAGNRIRSMGGKMRVHAFTLKTQARKGYSDARNFYHPIHV